MLARRVLTYSLVGLSCVAVAAAQQKELCGKFDSYNSSSREFTFDNNIWNSDGTGTQCSLVSGNGTRFDVTWKWKDTQSVHSYPHVTFNSEYIPIRLSAVESLTLKTPWEIVLGSYKSRLYNGDLNKAKVVSNVAIDIFAAEDPGLSQGATTASHEIMIWLGSCGSPQPLGYSKGAACWTQGLGDVQFNLYTGQNQRGLTVFTWIAQSNVADLTADISPLLQALWRNKLIPETIYIGLVQFGTEAFSSEEYVTFSTRNFSMKLVNGTAPDLNVTTGPFKCSRSKASTHRSPPLLWAPLLLVFWLALQV